MPTAAVRAKVLGIIFDRINFDPIRILLLNLVYGTVGLDCTR